MTSKAGSVKIIVRNQLVHRIKSCWSTFSTLKIVMTLRVSVMHHTSKYMYEFDWNAKKFHWNFRVNSLNRVVMCKTTCFHRSKSEANRTSHNEQALSSTWFLFALRTGCNQNKQTSLSAYIDWIHWRLVKIRKILMISSRKPLKLLNFIVALCKL